MILKSFCHGNNNKSLLTKVIEYNQAKKQDNLKAVL
jgi:hypothetical protein